MVLKLFNFKMKQKQPQHKLQKLYNELYHQIEDVKTEIKIAEQFFNLAQGDYIEVAILQLETAKKRYNALYKEIKSIGYQLDLKEAL